MKPKVLITAILSILLLLCKQHFCTAQTQRVIPGDEQTETYLPLLRGKKVAIFSNHTGMVGKSHLLDLLLEQDINVTAIFSPEHGFRGQADAGEHVSSSVDLKTGVPILSLYNGKEKRPSPESMKKFDVLVVDIQDVGLRFYTYYITMHRLMEACAEHNRQVIILDRPNPNGHYVDGPLLDMKYKSGVGSLPIPVVHGMTLGELGLMINGEHWLKDSLQCALTVIPCQNYTHQTIYELPIAPSPNLPCMKAIYLYPSLCFFEGTPVSLGRGTELPFQIYGHPKYEWKKSRIASIANREQEEKKNPGNDNPRPCNFTPRSLPGAKNPPQLNRLCHGVDLSQLNDSLILQRGIDLSYLIDAYHNLNIGEKFFTSFFELLIGVDYVRPLIMQGYNAEEIKQRWQPDVERFKQQRKPYLLYQE